MWMMVILIGVAEACIIGLVVFIRARHLNDDKVVAYNLIKDEIEQKQLSIRRNFVKLPKTFSMPESHLRLNAVV
jgi:hypothetical protein